MFTLFFSLRMYIKTYFAHRYSLKTKELETFEIKIVFVVFVKGMPFCCHIVDSSETAAASHIFVLK